jgi:hypothetical protein
MPVLPAMGDREPRRVAEAVGRAMHDLGDLGQVGMCCAKSRWSARYARSSASSSWQRVPATRWSLSTNTVTEYGDICRMRLEDRSFDTAVSTLVLDVVPDAARRGDFCGAWVRLAVC